MLPQPGQCPNSPVSDGRLTGDTQHAQQRLDPFAQVTFGQLFVPGLLKWARGRRSALVVSGGKQAASSMLGTNGMRIAHSHSCAETLGALFSRQIQCVQLVRGEQIRIVVKLVTEFALCVLLALHVLRHLGYQLLRDDHIAHHELLTHGVTLKVS
jgi:hypothetical protein